MSTSPNAANVPPAQADPADVKLAAGVDFFVETYLDAPDAGQPFPKVLKTRLTAELIQYVDKMSRQVFDLGVESIKTGRMPGIGQLASDMDKSCGLWSGVIDEEAFRYVAGEGPPGLTSVSIFADEVMKILRGQQSAELYQWHAGCLLLRAGKTSPEVMVRRVEAAFPEVVAARVGQQMDTTISGLLGTAKPAATAPVSRRRRVV